MAMEDKDISEVRHRLQTLSDPLGLMAGLFIHAPTAFAVSNAAGHAVMVNQAFLKLFGSEPPPEYSIFEDELVAARGITPLARRALAGETVRTPTFWYDPRQNGVVEVEGRRVAISIAFFPIRDQSGAVTHFVMAYENYTAEAEARERLRQVMDLVPMHIYARDLEGRYLLANRPAAQRFGLEPEQVEGRLLAELDAAGAAAQLQDDQAVAREGHMRVAPEESLVLSSGQERILYSLKMPYTAAGSGNTAVLAVSLDITERKNTEAQLRQSQRMESVGRLAGGVAHDFNNLLTVIQGYADILLEGMPSSDPRRDDVAQIGRATERAADLTRHLLAYSRQQVLEPKVVDLNAVILNMDKLFQRLIGEDIELLTQAAPGLDRVKVDTGQMEQVLMNLVVNARDAMPAGGKVTIETSNVVIDDGYAREHVDVSPGPHVMLAVSDTGRGMDKATQARIFEPFFTTKDKGKGTGLGLATVFGIVKQSGGHIWVYSEPGEGSTFKVYFPRSSESPAPAAQAPAHAPAQQVSETILVVEDEEQLAGLMVRNLRKAGYQVLQARNGPEALGVALAYKGPIHLLLTDVIMPKMTGRQLAQELAPARPDMQVLYVSGYTDNSIVHHGILDPGVAFLQKPFSFEVLIRRVREILG